ncbi:MAG: methanogen output domain 1-containing protein [Methanosarcinaceae archaeon]|nr:methanogen output domain 1-containing protein [Methanosarcinaceae archaeon]
MDEKTGFDNIADLLHINLFGGFPKKMTEIVGENAAIMLLRECAKESFLVALSRPDCNLKPTDEIKALAEKNDYPALFNYCYRVLERVGYIYEGETIVDSDSNYSMKITKCPHIDFVKEQPIACNVCKGMKLGIFEAVFGKPVEFETIKNMAQGDEYCLSVFKKPAK